MLRSVISQHSVDFAGLQELGVASDDVPPGMRVAFGDSTLLCAACVTGGTFGVGLIASKRWAMVAGSVLRHKSGRAVGAVFSCGSTTVAAMSVHMPSGLDFRHLQHADRMLASDLHGFVSAFAAAHQVCLILGDFNETRTVRPGGPEERFSSRRDVFKRAAPVSLIDELVADGAVLVDLFRTVNPGLKDHSFYCCKKVSPSDGGPVYELLTTARIDYILAPAWLLSVPGVTVTCEILDQGSFASLSDHAPVVGKLAGPKGVFPQVQERSTFSPNHPSISGLSDADIQLVVAACQQAAGKWLREWEAVRRGDLTPLQRRQTLQSLGKKLVVGVRNSMRSKTAGGRNRIPDRDTGLQPSPPALQSARALVSSAVALRRSLALIRARQRNSCGSPHRRDVGRFQRYAGVRVARADDLAGLQSAVDLVLGDDNGDILLRRAAEQGVGEAERLHSRAQDLFAAGKNGQLIAEFMKSQACAGFRLDSARMPNGTMSYDPREYLPIVRDQVFAPMATKLELPAAQAPLRPSVVPPFTSARLQDVHARPAWWDRAYNRDAKGIPAAVFAQLADPLPWQEICSALLQVGPSSPGFDGLSGRFLRILVAPTTAPLGKMRDTNRELDRIPEHPTMMMQALTALLNECVIISHIPPFLKHGWVTLVPKLKADGSFSTVPGEMRPITVLPAIGRLLSKVLATRLVTALALHPEVLHKAQRAFIRDGTHSQCVETLINVIEDWHQTKNLGAPLKQLFIISYDQSKAYDSVQSFTVRATLERFNMPEPFIALILSGITGATSQVRTAGGLTAAFPLQSSLLQGDPLAPILYVLVSDLLHEGLESCPLFPERSRSWGYVLRPDNTGHAERVCSTGFADDTAAAASEPGAAAEMHSWVRAFFGANGFALNTVKTHLLCSDPTIAPLLPSVDAATTVAPEGPSAVFRYLGVHLNLDLDWTTQIALVDRKVRNVCRSIRLNKLDALVSAMVFHQYLLPCIRGPLLAATIPAVTLHQWDSLIRSSLAQGMGAHLSASLGGDPVRTLTNILSLADHYTILRGTELLVSANSSGSASDTLRSRLQPPLGGIGHVANRARDTLRALERPPFCSAVRVEAPGGQPAVVRLLNRPGLWDPTSCLDVNTSWRPDSIDVWADTRLPAPGWEAVDVFTDGSYKEGYGGAGMVVVPAGTSWPRYPHHLDTGHFDNYISELAAIASCLTVVPLPVRLRVVTDALSGDQIIDNGRLRAWSLLGSGPGAGRLNAHAMSQRKQLLCAGRALLRVIRALIALRPHPVSFIHVFSHSLGTDRLSVLNAVADVQADLGRAKAAELEQDMSLGWEYPYSLHVDNRPCHGSYRAALMKQAREAQTARWLALPRQGRILRLYPAGTLALIAGVQRTKDPDLLRFVLLALTEWLPTEHRLEVAGGRGRGGFCKLCPGQCRDTLLHALSCPHPALVCLRKEVTGGFVQALRPERVVCGGAVPAFFDPVGNFSLPCWPSPPPDLMTKYYSHDPLAGMLGVLPEGMLCILTVAPKTEAAGPEDCLTRCRLVLLRGALRLWSLRCRLVNDWWYSDAGRAHWGSVLARRLERLRVTGQRHEAEALRRWAVKYPESAPARRSPRVPPPRDYSMPMVTTTAADEAEAGFLDSLAMDSSGLLRPPRLPRW
jgi:hypothetical protein